MKYSKYAMKLVKLTFRLSKKFYIYSISRAITNALKTFVAVYGLSLIIEGLVSNNYETALLYAMIVVGLEVLLRFLEITFDTSIEISRLELIERIKIHMSTKVMSVEYKYLEDPEYLEVADKARFAIDNFQSLYAFLNNVIDMINQFIIMCTLLTIIIVFSPIILAIIFISIIMHFIVSKQSAKKQVKLYNELGPVNRKFTYYTNVIQDVRYQKDYRMYPLKELVHTKYVAFLNETSNYLIYFNKMIGRYQMFYSVINYIQITAIYLFIGYISITQSLGVATYVLLTASAMRASGAINGFASRFIRIRENVQLLKPVFEILDMEDSVTLSQSGLQCPSLESIEFENVSFKYPNTDNYVLKNVSFKINKGEKVSIVGLNGAGKTTIVKLISRFFTPDKGTIYWNGVNINNYEYESYINEISAVFQDFKLFALTLSENVDLEVKDEEHIKNCLNNVGLKEKIESLPNKEKSFLSKEYSDEGIELSGGQQQKIAIARAMYQESSLAILDEPTSALDPISEAEIYERFSELVKDKTTIYISHRMSSSVFCDKIVVLENGTVSTIDTHQNLMKNKVGTYFELFNAQSNYYN